MRGGKGKVRGKIGNAGCSKVTREGGRKKQWW